MRSLILPTVVSVKTNAFTENHRVLEQNFREELIAYFVLIRYEPHSKRKINRGIYRMTKTHTDSKVISKPPFTFSE
jgi:hypothetical protein